MNKKKILAASLLLLVILAAILYKGNKVVYGISEGTYVKQTEENYVPFVYFDMNQESVRFWMAADKRVSFAYRGAVELKNGYVYLNIENGGETWVFEVIDNDTIAFVQSKSDECQLAKDGDIFIYQEN